MSDSNIKAIIAPSMLSSDFANLASEAERILECGAGECFVSNIFCCAL